MIGNVGQLRHPIAITKDSYSQNSNTPIMQKKQRISQIKIHHSRSLKLMPRLRNIIWLSEKRLNSIPLVGYIVQQWTDLSTIFVDISIYIYLYSMSLLQPNPSSNNKNLPSKHFTQHQISMAQMHQKYFLNKAGSQWYQQNCLLKERLIHKHTCFQNWVPWHQRVTNHSEGVTMGRQNHNICSPFSFKMYLPLPLTIF